MSRAPLQSALAELQGHFPSAPIEDQIVRVEARDEQLIFTLNGAVRERYFRWNGELQELSPSDDAALKIWRTAFVEREPVILTWRPGRRLVASFVVAGKPVILKAYKKRRMPQAFANQQRLFKATRNSEAFIVARPIASDESGAAYTMERLHGDELRIESYHATSFEMAGRALRQMQASVGITDLPEHKCEQELERLRALAARVQMATGTLPADWPISFEHARMSACATGSGVPAHGDLHDGNLMRIGSRVGLLDFDMLCVGDAALDLANLSAHLELRALQGIRGASLAGAAACDQALRRGFGQQNCEFARSLEFHRATTFLRIALIYHLRPRWAALTPGLVRLAESCLHEVTLLR